MEVRNANIVVRNPQEKSKSKMKDSARLTRHEQKELICS